MMRLRLFTIVLIVWLTVLFNMSRPGIFIGDIDLSLQLSPVVYVIAAAVVLIILLLPDLGQVRLWKLLLALLLIYGVLRFTFTPFNPVKPKITTYFIVTEVLALVGTVVAARFLSLVVSNVEHAVETVLASQENSRILPKSDRFEQFNKKLERARRFTRPLEFIYITIGILTEMHATI